ncbi:MULTISPECIES: type III secretion system gatekeeper subunit SctW [Pantoea]|uniref:Type III secretion protein W n=1 Tax=Candidatus Pantoea floridensis TaxID=1938870 RepID=A0A286C058_9GAMM|nr:MULTISPECIES: type III secretion system gatekeeper subunit SctW [Pantoea]PIF22261.1 type III secretion protein W [Enterobacteriaceae bacterium JKS000233]PXW18457.1 type III secretion protein W [Pantoea sp. JKS000250]SOD39768.1 type III secretion protein W [Pantoea floridensis]
MNMKIHHTPVRHFEVAEKEEAIEELGNIGKGDSTVKPGHETTHAERLKKEQASHVAEHSLAQEIDQHRAKIEKQQQIARSRRGGYSLRFTHIEQISELLEGGHDEEQAKREDRIKAILEESPEHNHFTAILETIDDDPASAYATLSLMALKLQDNHQPQLLASIQTVLDKLSHEHGAEVTAGMNTARAFATHSTDKTQKRTLRKLYYDGVVGQQTSDSVMDLLLSKFGVEGYLPALRTLQRALADDIAALSPSIPPMALRRLLNGLNDTRVLSNTITEVSEFLTRMSSTFRDVKMSVDKMTRTLLGMCRNGFFSNQLISLGLETIGEDSQRHPFYFNHLLRLIQRLPENVWGDNGKHRDSAIRMIRALNGELAQMEKNRLGQMQ